MEKKREGAGKEGKGDDREGEGEEEKMIRKVEDDKGKREEDTEEERDGKN